MKGKPADDTVIERLLGALETDALPEAAREYAQHLLNRLSQPVRVSLLGKPGSGKSELVNMFAGDRVIPRDAKLPTTEYVWADAPEMTVTTAAGEVTKHDSFNVASISGTNAAFLRLGFPAPILKRVNLLEVVTEGNQDELEMAVDWAVRRTDIALWCTQVFDEVEEAVWGRVPDSLKDHAFLVLSKADVLSAEKALSQRIAGLESVVAEEFHSLFAVATLQAIRSQSGEAIDEAMFHASGGGALRSEVLRHAGRGRRADFDSAHMFLARYHVPELDPAAIPKARAEAEKPSAPTPANDPVAASTVATEVAPEAVPEKNAAPAQVSAPVAEITAPKVKNVALYVESVQYLKRRGEGLTQSLSAMSEGQSRPVVNQCVNAVEHLMDVFSQDESGCEAADAFIDDLSDAADMMVLFQAEDGDVPAADAATLLLQLRRDMEMQLAA